MTFHLKERQSYEQPPGGRHRAICVQFLHLGVIVRGQYGEKDTIQLIFQLESSDARGRRFQLRRKYTNSTHEKSAIVIEVNRWLGKKMTKAEWKAFDVESLVGRNCELTCVQVPMDDGEEKTFIDIINAPRAGEENDVVAQDYKPCAIPTLNEGGYPDGGTVEVIDEVSYP